MTMSNPNKRSIVHSDENIELRKNRHGNRGTAEPTAGRFVYINYTHTTVVRLLRIRSVV